MPGNPPLPSAVPGARTNLDLNDKPLSPLGSAYRDVIAAMAGLRRRDGGAALRDPKYTRLEACRVRLIQVAVAQNDTDLLDQLTEQERTEAGTSDALAKMRTARRGPAPSIKRRSWGS